MKTHVDCFPCIINQTLEAAQKNQIPDDQKKEIVYNVLEMLRDLPEDISPPEVSHRMHRLIGKSLGNDDPYQQARSDANVMTMDLIPGIRKKIKRSGDPLETAVRYAIAGQVFDGEAAEGRADIHRELEYAPKAEFGINHLKKLTRALYEAKRVVYLANAAGEIAFDRLLIEVLRDMFAAEIVMVVRKDPVLTNATLDDAAFVGVEPLVHLVANTSDAPATVIEDVSSGVSQQLNDADVVIAKGQTHYESLNNADLNIFFLFQINCPVISKELDADLHQYMVLQC